MKTVYKVLTRSEAILAATLLMLMVAVIFLGGLARMMHVPLNWTVELATCCFAWACFLCADIAWRNNMLMSIDAFVELFPQPARRVMLYMNYAIITCFLCYLVYSGGWLAWISRARSFQGISGVSYSWVTASLPVGAALLLTTTILKVRDALREDGIIPSAQEKV
jgi:TRAP-type C4-dicarboxylate transport system permease small subunit